MGPARSQVGLWLTEDPTHFMKLASYREPQPATGPGGHRPQERFVVGTSLAQRIESAEIQLTIETFRRLRMTCVDSVD